jgi:hypothetical protein
LSKVISAKFVATASLCEATSTFLVSTLLNGSLPQEVNKKVIVNAKKKLVADDFKIFFLDFHFFNVFVIIIIW